MKAILHFLLAGMLLTSAGCATGQEPPVVTSASPPPTVATSASPMNEDVTMFYDSLAPYGEWVWLEPNGWVWSPNGVSVGWRPYTEGSWAYTDHGWTWVSDVSWGWAPYHYGRWFFHEHRGWCWVPDRVWGPAWVAWHFGDSWCGWAPLPPRVSLEASVNWDSVISPFAWCFVGREDFLRPRLHEHVIVAARNVTLLRETRNVTRFEVRDRRVINSSLSAEQVERFTGKTVVRTKLVDVNSPTVAERGVRRGELRVFRPEPRPGAVAAIPRRTPETLARPAPPAAATATWDQLRRTESERARLETAQRTQHEALERSHQRELAQPPRGLSPGEIQQRHQAEHQAFNEQMSRERQVFEHRAPVPSAAPPPPDRSGAPQRSSGPAGRDRIVR